MIARVRHKTPEVGPMPRIEDASSTDGLVRLHVASRLQNLPMEARFPISGAPASHAEDANDRQQPLMLWHAIEPAVIEHPERAIALAIESKIPKLRRLIARRLAEEIERTPSLIDDLLKAGIRHVDGCEDIVRGLSEALRGLSRAAKPRQRTGRSCERP